MHRMFLAVSACIFATLLAAPLMAQASNTSAQATAMAHDVFQLTVAAPAVTRPLLVDTTSSFALNLIAASSTLTVSLKSPAGAQFTIGSPANSAFQSSIIPVSSGTTSGASYVGIVANPQVGTWTLGVSDTVLHTTPLNVVTSVAFNNATKLVLAGGDASFPTGTNVRMALVAFDGTKRLSGVTIAARVVRASDSTFPPAAVTFRDDGTGADETAGNGIYEAFVSLGQPGRYVVQADVTGTASTGAFHRTATAQLQIVPHNAQITGFSDDAIDDNFDGLIDRVGIVTTAHISEAGTYTVSVRLRASNGHEIQASVKQALASGDGSAEVKFAASDIERDLGVDGPYQVAEVRYYELVSGDLLPADIRYDLGLTGPFTLSGLQHPSLRLNGVGQAQGVDNNGNGLFDLLEITLGVSVDVGGSYDASVSLLDRNGHEIGFASGSVSLDTGEDTLTIDFDGSRIGQNGVGGPYTLANFIMFGEETSLIVTNAFTTPAFSASQFEGYKPPSKRHLAPH